MERGDTPTSLQNISWMLKMIGDERVLMKQQGDRRGMDGYFAPSPPFIKDKNKLGLRKTYRTGYP